MLEDREPLIYRMPVSTPPTSLGLALDQLLCNLAAQKADLLRELGDPRLHPHPSLVLVPVNADTGIQDGVTYLTVQYKVQVRPEMQHFPENSK